MATRKPAKKTTTSPKPPINAAPRELVQDALQTTWLLKGNLKNAQLAYMRVGALLEKVRDKKLYSALGHQDMEGYAQQRLNLGRSSLYNYLKIHTWVSTYHPEWLKPKARGFIPDLSDIGDLIWIDTELGKKDLVESKRTALVELQQKALAGNLRQSELRALRQGNSSIKKSVASFLSSLRSLRKRAGKIADLPPEALAQLDSIIEIVSNENSLKMAGFKPFYPDSIEYREGMIA